MIEKEKLEIKEMTETAKYLADNDPPSLLWAKSNMDILKARCDLDQEVNKRNDEGNVCGVEADKKAG